MSSVYLMKNMDNGYYKLGFSDRPEYRERTLQAQEPDVRLLATVSGTKELEQKLELGFAKHRVRGEWFSFSGLALSSIAEVFGVSVEMIDPPSETFDVQYCVAHIHRYAGPQYSTRLLEKCTKEVILEVPYVLSPSEAQVELDAEGRAWNIELQWQSDHLRTAFRVIQLSEYRLATISRLPYLSFAAWLRRILAAIMSMLILAAADSILTILIDATLRLTSTV